MIENQKFAAAVLLTCTFLAACAGESVAPKLDVRPIGQGLEFLGIALVLATLVAVLGKFIRK